MKLVPIQAGEFTMGAPPEEIAKASEWFRKQLNANKGNIENQKRALENSESEGPQHRVSITRPFYLGSCLVTQKQFTTVMGWNPSAYSANGSKKDEVLGTDTNQFPVENLSWEQAVAFCQELSALPEEAAAGRTYRLPTEAEWEYACRARTKTKYYWGEDHRPGIAYEWTRTGNDSEVRPRPVGQKKPNPWGLYDMCGNVRQWCADWYGPKTYTGSDSRDPRGPEEGTGRIVRGGYFGWGINSSRAAARQGAAARSRSPSRGFRVACDVSSRPSVAPPSQPAVTPTPDVAPPPVVEAPKTTTAKTSGGDPESRLREKGLSKHLGYFTLADEAPFIRYTNTIERLRVACFHAQKECQEAQTQLDRVRSMKVESLKARITARTYMNYSDTWREHWNAVRARNNATDAMIIADLSQEDLRKWQKDARDDYNDAVNMFGRQCRTLRQMFDKIQTQYVSLAADAGVKWALAEVNNAGKAKYQLGPTPIALTAAKKLEREEAVHEQLKKAERRSSP
jgi:formylglycine-generating enzyme required for sulfatase activity